MRKLTFMIFALIAVAGCGNSRGGRAAEVGEDMVENGKIGYADLVSFIVQGYQCHWESMSPEDQGLSPVYSYSSPYAGFAEKDINGDGIDELLIGDQFEDGNCIFYDIYTINPSDGSLIHLAKGGERDRFSINGSGVIVESGSNSAFDSFTVGYVIRDGALEELDSWEEDMMEISLEKFNVMAVRSGLVGAFGNQREITDEEMAMFRSLTDDGGGDGLYSAFSIDAGRGRDELQVLLPL